MWLLVIFIDPAAPAAVLYPCHACKIIRIGSDDDCHEKVVEMANTDSAFVCF